MKAAETVSQPVYQSNNTPDIVSRPSRPLARSTVGLALAIYTLLAFFAGPSVWIHGPTTHLYNAGNGDVDEGVWFLAQTPYALIHGINPLANNWLHYPSGVNLMDNTAMQLLGLLVAPVTLLWGPVLSYNLLVLLAYPLAAMAAFLVIRKWTVSSAAAFVGGIVYGFSPYMVAMGNGHLMTLFVPIPALLLWLMHRIMVERRGSALRNGALLGLLLAAQLFVSVEVLTTTLVVMAAGIAIVALDAAVLGGRLFRCLPVNVRGSRHALQVRYMSYLGKAAIAGGLVLAVVAAYPLWIALRGPEHIVGPAQTVNLLKGLSADVLTPIIPTINQHFAFGMAWHGTELVAEHGKALFPDASENGGYIGIPLLVGLLAGVGVLWRVAMVRFAAAMAVIVAIVSMGSELHIDGHFVWVPLPFDLLAHVPLLDSQIAARYSLYMWLFVAVLVALVADRMLATLKRLGRVRGALFLAVAFCVAFLPLIPAWPYGTGNADVPGWFTSDRVGSVPVGSTLLTYPFPSVADPAAMLWQAAARMRFRMPGGYLITPGPGRRATFEPPLNALSMSLLECAGGTAPALGSSTDVAAIRGSLRVWRIDTVVVPEEEKGSGCAVRVISSALGVPHRELGSDVWSNVRTSLDVAHP